MAEENDATSRETPTETQNLQRRSRDRRPATRGTTNAVASRPAPSSTARRPAATARARRAKPRPLRSLATLTIVAGLVATVALPAYGAFRQSEDARTLQQIAADDAQSLVVASNADTGELTRSSYAATSQKEIDDKKAKEAAAAAAAARARASASVASVNVNLQLTSPGSGEVRWPLTSAFTVGDRVGSRGGEHQGTDMLTPCGQPIFAATAGVVRVSQESYGGFGVAVAIDGVVGGAKVGTIYGHMTYGSRVVSVGQTVAAGQIIGLVGSTGRSTACHLHFETWINGGLADSYAWLQQNAG